MNHKERVFLSLAHKEPDRVSIDLWGCDNRINNELYFKIIDKLGLDLLREKIRPGKTAEYEDYRISDLIDADFRHVTIGRAKYFKKFKDNEDNIIDEWGVGSKLIGNYPQVTFHPFQSADIKKIKNHLWPDASDPGRTDGIESKVKDWFNNTDYYITTNSIISGLIIETYQYLRGMTEFFTDLYLEQSFAHSLIEKVTDVLTDLHINFIKPISKFVNCIEFATDFGTQNSLIMSKEMLNKFIKKPMKRMFESIRSIAPEAKILLHSCGAIKEYIPEIIDMGVDILSGLQTRAKGMNPIDLKKEYGKYLVFRGGIDIQKALCGSEFEIITDVKEKIKSFAPGGGYIVAPSNHFQSDVSVENFFILYKTAKEFGKYPIKTNDAKSIKY